MNSSIKSPFKQDEHHNGDNFEPRSISSKLKHKTTIEQFKNDQAKYEPNLFELSARELQDLYWNSLTQTSKDILYYSDQDMSLFTDDCEFFNLNNLKDLFTRTYDVEDYDWKGVNQPYCYFGSWRSTFPFHLEDMNLGSINYLHYGAPKCWYTIPTESKAAFEQLLERIYQKEYKHCNAFFRHKTMLLDPSVLDQHKIKYNFTIQHPNEFILTFPGGWHAGFNIAEAINYGTKNWVKYGLNAIKYENKIMRFDDIHKGHDTRGKVQKNQDYRTEQILNVKSIEM